MTKSKLENEVIVGSMQVKVDGLNLGATSDGFNFEFLTHDRMKVDLSLISIEEPFKEKFKYTLCEEPYQTSTSVFKLQNVQFITSGPNFKEVSHDMAQADVVMRSFNFNRDELTKLKVSFTGTIIVREYKRALAMIVHHSHKTRIEEHCDKFGFAYPDLDYEFFIQSCNLVQNLHIDEDNPKIVRIQQIGAGNERDETFELIPKK